MPHQPPAASPRVYEAGDKVFLPKLQRLATVLDVYGNGMAGANGDMRLDVCGNTALSDFEPYDPVNHAKFDHTFLPIKREWARAYGVTKPVALRD